MAGEVTVIAKLAPQANAFVGLVDAEQVIGDGYTNVVPDLAISESSVLQYVEDRLYADQITIYVDPTGDDAYDGSSASPVQTLYEASKRIAAHGITTLQLSAGTHLLPDFTDEAWVHNRSRMSIGTFGQLIVRGTVNILEQFTVSGVTENVITATGSPGWTVDEHIGKAVRWLEYGSEYPDYYSALWIISNTANTITVTHTPSGLGGSDPNPSGLVDITENASIITTPSNGFWGDLEVYGQSTWSNIEFDGTLGGSSGENGILCTADSSVEVKGCSFKNWDSSGISGGASLQVNRSLFDNCAVGIYAGKYSVINGNNFFRNKLNGTAIEARYGGGTEVVLNHACAAWMENIKIYLRVGNTCSIDDGSTRYWVGGTCQMLTELWSFAFYKFSISTGYQRGMTGKDTFSVRVHYLWQPDAYIVSFNSQSCTLKPDATFFSDGTTHLSLTDYVADGKSVEFENGTTAIG